MPILKTHVVGPLVLPNGDRPKSAVLRFQLHTWDKSDNETILMGPIDVACDVNADFDVELWASVDGFNSTIYSVSVTYFNDDMQTARTDSLGVISVPALGPVNLSDLLTGETSPIIGSIGLAHLAANTAGATAATFTVSEVGSSRVIAWTGAYIRVGGVQVALADYSGTLASGEVLTIPNPYTTAPIPVTKSTLISVSDSVADFTSIVILRNTIGMLSELMAAAAVKSMIDAAIAMKADATATQTALDSKMDAVASKLVTDALRDVDHRDANDGYYGAVVDQLGKLAFAVGESGNVQINDYEVFDAPDREGNPFLWGVKDQSEKVAFGVKSDGTVFGGSSEVIPPSTFSTTIPVANVSLSADHYSAIRVDTASYSVRRNLAGTEALIESLEPITILPFFGQSNAGNSGDAGGPFVTVNPYPQIAVSFAGGWSVHGSTEASEIALASGDLAPIVDVTINNALVTFSAYAMEATSRDRDAMPSNGVFAFSSWYGGQPIDQFIKGSTLYENMRRACRAAKTIAAEYGRTIELPAIVFVQGETPGVLDYKTTLEDIAANLKADLTSDLALVASPEFMLLQTNDSDIAAALVPTIELAQIEAVGVTPAGPMYQQPFQDDIHGNYLGRMVLADSLSDALRILRDTGSFNALRPLSATRTGTQVDVVYSVPAHGLKLDDDWVKPAENYGFKWKDDASSATITSVEIVGFDTVRLTLSAVPTGANPFVEYALWQDSTDDGWASGRGQIYSPTRTESRFWKAGHEIPQFARHYALRTKTGVV